MKSCIFNHYLSKLQNTIYLKVNDFSKSHKNLGRFSAIPVAMLDVGLETIKTPLRVIERLAFAAINLFGAAFNAKCNLKDALNGIESMLNNLITIPITITMIPLKLFYQTFAIVFNPDKIGSINYNPSFGHDRTKIVYN